MKRFRNLLAVHERKEDTVAIREALRLAEQNGGRLTIVQALPEVPGALANLAVEKSINLPELLHQEALEQIEEIVRRYSRTPDLDVSIRLLHGVDFIEIIRQVLRNEHDLVLKSAGPEIEFGDHLFGSLDLHLLRKCPCPVWLLTPERRNRHRPRVMAAVNVTSEEPVHEHLNGIILDLASSQAIRMNAALDIVAAWRLPGESMLRGRLVDLSDGEVEGMLGKTRSRFEERLNRLVAARIPTELDFSVHFRKGNAAENLVRFAVEKEVTLMVMGTVARTGLSGLFISNTVESMLGHVPCSVMAVKPPGFETPVRVD